MASEKYKLNVTPTGVLALDYALGTGGWPRGHQVEVFGAPDIGKTTLALSGIREAQKDGQTCGIIALEPGFDAGWAMKHGVDPDWVVIARPDHGADAFAILHDWVHDDVVDFIVFDSIGAVLRETEAGEDGKQAAGGASSLITWGVKNATMPVWKNNKTVIYLNQIRDDMKARIAGLVDSPGGHALEHLVAQRIYLKPGRQRYTEKVDGDDVLAGRELVATIKRNKMHEGTGRKATYEYWQLETEDHRIGVDSPTDVLNTALKLGVIERAGAYYSHPSLGDGNIQGSDRVKEMIVGNPAIKEDIRNDVISKMIETTQKEADGKDNKQES